MKNIKQDKMSFEKKLTNSKFDFCHNFKWFAILPAVVVLIGIILFATLGFNLGSSYISIKVYANSEGYVQQEQVYNLDKDYGAFTDRIAAALDGFEIENFVKTTMDVNGYIKSSAVEVHIKFNGDEGTKEGVKTSIKTALQNEFEYYTLGDEDWSEAISEPIVNYPSIDESTITKCMIALLVALVLAAVYLAFRFNVASAFASMFAVFHDILIAVSLVLICRLQISVSFVAIIMIIAIYSIYTNLVLFSRIRENIKSGLYELSTTEQSNKLKGNVIFVNNCKIANASIKEVFSRSLITTVIFVGGLAMLAVVGIAINSVAEFVLPILFGTVATFYSSVLLSPALWAVAYKPRKKKKTVKKAD